MLIAIGQEDDGRFIAEISAIPDVMAYGETAKEAIGKIEALVLRILADCIDAGEEAVELADVFTVSV
jgi:predicted RNase H-like HicB family nuclease